MAGAARPAPVARTCDPAIAELDLFLDARGQGFLIPLSML